MPDNGKPEIAITLTTAEDVLSLIDDLRLALKRSRESGGRYLAHLDDPAARLLLWVHVPAKGCDGMPPAVIVRQNAKKGT